jgi:hypothetical protein
MVEPERRRRRLRTPSPPAQPPTPIAPVSPPPAPEPAEVKVGRPGGDESERGLRGLVGSGSSQVSVGAAMRARDAARPTEEQLAEAETLAVVRRNWMPREDLPRNR